MKAIVYVLLAVGLLTSGFTCSKNQPEEAPAEAAPAMEAAPTEAAPEVPAADPAAGATETTVPANQ